MNNILDKIKKILTGPVKFFTRMKQEKGIEGALIYLLILSLFYIILASVIGSAFQQYSYSIMSKLFDVNLPRPHYTGYMLVLLAILGYLLIIASSFIAAGILHAWILIFGGKGSYTKTYQLYVYSRTPHFIFGWIPFVSFAAWIYDLILLIIGTEKIHKINRTRAILMYVIPAIFIVIAYILTLIFVIFLFKYVPQNESLSIPLSM